MTDQSRAPLILASASPRRSELLARLGLSFTARAADIDESARVGESPKDYCARLSCEKAGAIYNQRPDSWVIGSDTIVVLGEQMLGKPASRAEAVACLSQLSGNTHEVITGVCLLGPQHREHMVIVSAVTFGQLSTQEIDTYCDTDEPYDKAGAYGIQGLGGVLVEHIAGDYSAIMGLPLRATWQLLAPYLDSENR